MKTQKPQNMKRIGASEEILFNEPIIVNFTITGKSKHKFLNEANTALAKSFIANGHVEEARAMLEAVGADRTLAFFLVAVWGGENE